MRSLRISIAGLMVLVAVLAVDWTMMRAGLAAYLRLDLKQA